MKYDNFLYLSLNEKKRDKGTRNIQRGRIEKEKRQKKLEKKKKRKEIFEVERVRERKREKVII